jgi:nitrile hydratase accessory protein
LSLAELIANSPGLPCGDEPVFSAPWEAQAFAMAVALNERGLFTWTEWAAALSAELKKPGAKDDASDYYRHWLAALESLVAGKGVAAHDEVDAVTQAWHRAARATPHGAPILIENDPGHD